MNSREFHCLALFSKCRSLRTLKQIHAFTFKTGLNSDPLVAGKLLLHCAVTLPDSVRYAGRLFLDIRNPDVFMYNTLIRGLSDSDTPSHALLLFVEMRRKSMALPDSFSFAFLLKAAANCRALRNGLQLHRQAIGYGLDTHLFVGTTLISMYAECASLAFARQVFDEMIEPNIVAWNAIVAACFRCEDVKDAEQVFHRMPIKNLTSWNIMLAGYTKAGELRLAREVFMKMPLKDEVSWSSMIVGFAHNGSFNNAFAFFRELRQEGMRPNEVSLTGALSACAQAGAFEFGRILHGFVEKSGFLQIVSVSNALIDTYSKCGNLDMARLIFDNMLERSVVSWTAMITGLAMHGYGEEAIRLFNEMEESNIKPDGITFISILYACSHAGLVDLGCSYFSRMVNIYGIEPVIEHYGCIVDLYGRAGKLQQAFDFVSQMPVSPNDIVWRTLLGACGIHGNLELAGQVKRRLFELDPENSGDHVLLSNIYAVAGKWKDVATLRRSMTHQKLKKTPGWSMIEVDRIMYSFVAGEKQNDIAEEAHQKLREIMSRLRIEGGYVPEVGSVLHDIEVEEKEDSVSQHSEKLAVAFGMVRLPRGRSIRVVKNLRICRDCHTVMKLISKVYEVEIVVRDRSRFHSFTHGSCSCRDYW
ncbi:pentatricopeptide repeat-containing protein At1g74630 [Cucurbita pepo subsp. pepo]|uniref:pentatricopeptide repeat-containing protein At1g74630 n=1 Tax=Cucurbita pepo subsp. pepo TaxID=3664 RepID=UPI000C9DA724|nr:pentatricopeptide repeat-containing protein At1g74630 [Cucurbita pepo subsp. pepo]